VLSEALIYELPVPRYHFNTNLLLAGITKALKWADGAAVRAELAQQVREAAADPLVYGAGGMQGTAGVCRTSSA